MPHAGFMIFSQNLKIKLQIIHYSLNKTSFKGGAL